MLDGDVLDPNRDWYLRIQVNSIIYDLFNVEEGVLFLSIGHANKVEKGQCSLNRLIFIWDFVLDVISPPSSKSYASSAWVRKESDSLYVSFRPTSVNYLAHDFS